MKSKDNPGQLVDVETRVRSNAGRAGMIAGLLILFGFFVLEWDDRASQTLLIYSLRLGGLAMVVIAVWSSIGVPIVLLLDGIVCGLVGILILLSTILFVVTGPITIASAICLVTGGVFLSACVRGCREYRALPRGADPAGELDAAVGKSFGNDEVARTQTPDEHAHTTQSRKSRPTPAHTGGEYLTKLAKKDPPPKR